MILVDPTVVVSQLSSSLEHLFQANNKVVYLSQVYPESKCFIQQLEHHMHSSISELGEVLRGLNLRMGIVDLKSLTLDEVSSLASISEKKRCMADEWRSIDARELAIFRAALNREAKSGDFDRTGTVDRTGIDAYVHRCNQAGKDGAGKDEWIGER